MNAENNQYATKDWWSRLKTFKEFTKDSEFTEEEALEFGREVSRKAMKRHKA